MSNSANFYILDQSLDKFEFCTKLCTQLWRKQQQTVSPTPLWIICSESHTAKLIDNLLWNAQQDSYIPHQIISNYAEFNPKQDCITISLAIPIPEWQGVIINLSKYPITQFKQVKIVEIVGHLEADKTIARRRYAQYKKLTFDMKLHNINT